MKTPAEKIAELAHKSATSRQQKPPSAATITPKLVGLADVEPEEVRWLWRDRIAFGKLTLLVGRPKEGKSFLTCFMAATISIGAAWPCGEDAPVGDTLFISVEDDPADTIRPRLDAAGASCRRVHLLQAAVVTSEKGEAKEVAFTLQNVELIRQALDKLPDCKLVVIAPIGSYLGGGVDAHRDNEGRSVLAPLAAIAAERGVAVLIVCHNRKADATHADDTTLGSPGFVGIARSILHLRTDPDDMEKRRRVFAGGGSNNGESATALAFRIAGKPPRLEWEPEPLAGVHADDLMKTPTERQRGPQAERREAAADWLRELLNRGPLPKTEVERQANEAGLSMRTVRRAQEQLDITPRPQGFAGGWMWACPPKWAKLSPHSWPRRNNLANCVKRWEKSPLPTLQFPQLAKLFHLGQLWGRTGLFEYADCPRTSDASVGRR